MGKELDVLGLRRIDASRRTLEFYVSGCPDQFATLSTQWLTYRPLVEPVSLTTLLQSTVIAVPENATVRAA